MYNNTMKIIEIADKVNMNLVHSSIWRNKTLEFAEEIVSQCINELEHLKGFSGINNDGDVINTTDWNLAIDEAQKLLHTTFLSK